MVRSFLQKICNMFYWACAAGVTFSGACMLLIWPDTCYRAFACLTVCCLLCILFDWLEGRLTE